MAPRDSRLADTWVRLRSENTDTSASGMVTATTSALRGLPRNMIRIRNTRPMPSAMVRPTLLHGRVDQFVAVDVRHDPARPRLCQLRVELGHLGVNAAQGLRGVLVFQHQHDAFDRVGIGVLADDAFALLVAQASCGPDRAPAPARRSPGSRRSSRSPRDRGSGRRRGSRSSDRRARPGRRRHWCCCC